MSLVYRIADEAERLGFHSVWAGDHLALPRAPTTPYPYGDDAGLLPADVSLLDPFAVLAAVAGRTERVRLGFGVTVLPYRHPLVVAKLVASIDALSNGRGDPRGRHRMDARGVRRGRRGLRRARLSTPTPRSCTCGARSPTAKSRA